MQTNEFIYENKRGTGPPGLWGTFRFRAGMASVFCPAVTGRKDGHRASGRRRGAVRKKEKKPLWLRRGLLWNENLILLTKYY